MTVIGHVWCCLMVKTLCWPCFVAAVKGEPLHGTLLPLGDLLTGHWQNWFYFKFWLNASENLELGSRAFVTDEHSWESDLNIIKPIDKHQSLPLMAFSCALVLKNKWDIKYFSGMKLSCLLVTRTVYTVKDFSTI